MTSYAEKIVKLTAEIVKMEKNPDDYNDADIEDVKVEIKQVEALIKELQLSIRSSTAVFQSLQVQVSPERSSPLISRHDANPLLNYVFSHQVTQMVETLNKLEKTYDKSLVLATRREYIKVQAQLEECEKRHQELFYPNIGEPFINTVSLKPKPFN